jgi:hypothetical protein
MSGTDSVTDFYTVGKIYPDWQEWRARYGGCMTNGPVRDEQFLGVSSVLSPVKRDCLV